VFNANFRAIFQLYRGVFVRIKKLQETKEDLFVLLLYENSGVWKFVSGLRQIGGFLRALRFFPPIKLIAKCHQIQCIFNLTLGKEVIDSHDIASSEKWCQCLDKKVQDFSVVKQNSNMRISKIKPKTTRFSQVSPNTVYLQSDFRKNRQFTCQTNKRQAEYNNSTNRSSFVSCNFFIRTNTPRYSWNIIPCNFFRIQHLFLVC
jgi:hypothetical protein